MQDGNEKKVGIVGRAERLDFPELQLTEIPARIDSGAKTSSIWAMDIRVEDGVLSAVLFGQTSPFFTGKRISFEAFDTTVVSTSTGEAQQRYKVRILVRLKSKKIRAWFTLADRSTQVYPVLIGRNVLLGKFVIDVRKGHTLQQEEKMRTTTLRARLDEEK